jgi:hypothetical protein
MNVSAVGHPLHYASAAGHRGGSNQVNNPPAVVETADDATASSETRAVSAHHDGPKGVVGLLQAGHFKGVAAVRLSINFHEQLSGLNREAARIRVEEAAASMDEQMAGALAAYPEDASAQQLQLVTEAQETFALAIHSAVQGFKSGESSQDDALAGMQTAFDDLMLALQASFAATDQTADAAADEQGTADITATLIAAADEAAAVPDAAPAGAAGYLASIGQVFNSLMEGLRSDMDTGKAIPQFTAPQGNGVAFEKFMAMYREITEIAAPVDAGTQPAAVIDQQV